jgi:LAO/AO transport system kinase
MEMADIYVVNKADRPGADRLRQEIEVMLGIRRGNAYRHVRAHHRPGTPPAAVEATGAWEPPVLTTVAAKGEGVEPLVEAIERHATDLAASGELAIRRRTRLAQHTRRVVDRALHARVWNDEGEALLEEGLEGIARGTMSPYQLAQDILARRGEVVHDTR